ncbi:Rv2629 family ribosome hibernation factor [Qaidamihabitans albus]|uniref:Rv2629 family ribosome hibernation factor n=1 Tax=Qaidamihabitans albus TaxID=2795733 RepID=UPI0018F1AAE3|nr:Vms1/Ankzf1 family peptidyl-tRNA hydrolase [Qaidamihabitans albus]
MDTTRLRELVTTDGPFASVYFEDTHATADAAKILDLTWRELREDLAGQGAPQPTLDALETAVRDSAPPVGRSGRGLIAAGDRVLVDHRLDEPPATSVARVSDLPYVLPLAEYGELPPPHVIVIVDHVGADLTVVDARGRVVDEHTTEGAEHPVHKVRGGGFAHRDMQAHTEETVRHNIDQVAEDVAKSAKGNGATLVVVAGEMQARKALYEALPEQVQQYVVELNSGGRHQGAANDELQQQVGDLLVEFKRQRRAREIERFRGSLGQRTGLAVQGLEATTTALQDANVETLLAGRPGDADVFTGPEPTQLSMQEAELKAYGVEQPNSRRADEALALAAIAARATIVHTGDELDLAEGFGAILRHD